MRRLSYVLILVLVAAVALVLTACVADKNRTTFLFDYKDIFSEEQEADINEACGAATKKYGVTFLVATCNRTGTKADLWGEDFLRKEGLSERDDYVVVIINAKDVGVDYHFDIYTYGRAVSRVSADEIENAVWSIYADRILTNDSATAASGVVEMVDQLGGYYEGLPVWLTTVVGIALGIVIGVIVIGRISKSYSRMRKNVTYPLDKYCKMNLTGREDQFLRSATTVVVIQNNSSGGGGHGGGFSGGGGGGGHRGGR